MVGTGGAFINCTVCRSLGSFERVCEVWYQATNSGCKMSSGNSSEKIYEWALPAVSDSSELGY